MEASNRVPPSTASVNDLPSMSGGVSSSKHRSTYILVKIFSHPAPKNLLSYSRTAALRDLRSHRMYLASAPGEYGSLQRKVCL